MGSKKKVGKNRQDKFYQLAKQQGYRARSAYKLVQLNRKFDFLSKAKAVVDLCAAPGGWLQVCSEVMPSNSIILGMDLVPILPIPNVKTHICDITTEEARTLLRKDLQGWKADVVLNDGAPNVGGAYSKDAFVQNHLCLKALHLASDTLRQGGTFVTKVFRSQDYVALLWVFKQLFKYCKATKPTSSRQESAEIFVVCQDYLAPSSIDPKIFDARFVFEQLDENKPALNVFHPKWGQQKRHRTGYDDNLGPLLRSKITVTEFISSSEPIALLSGAAVIEWDEEADVFKSLKATTNEIKACLVDLKVLGKSEFSALVKWRLKMKKYKESLEGEADDDEAPEDEEKPAKTEEDEYTKLRREEVDLRLKVQAANKREKKKERRDRAKRMQRIALGIDNEGGETVNEGDAQEQVFSLSGIKNSDDLNALHDVNLADVDPSYGVIGEDDSDEENSGDDEEDSGDDRETPDYEAELEMNLDAMYEQYAEESKTKRKARLNVAKKARLITKARRDAMGQENMMEVMKEMDTDMADYVALLGGKNREATGLTTNKKKKKKNREGDDDDDSDLDVDSSDDDDDNEPAPSKKRRAGGGLYTDLSMVGGGEVPEHTSMAEKRWFGGSNNDLFQEAEDEAAATTATSLMDIDMVLDDDDDADDDEADDEDDDLEFEDDSHVTDVIQKAKAAVEAKVVEQEPAVAKGKSASAESKKGKKNQKKLKGEDVAEAEAPKVKTPPPARQFLPSKKFKGTKDGYVFTTRNKKTGYYLEKEKEKIPSKKDVADFWNEQTTLKKGKKTTTPKVAGKATPGVPNSKTTQILDEDGDLLVDMPKTDKQLRKDKRKKDAERNERKLAKREMRAAKDEGTNGAVEGFEVVTNTAFDEAAKKEAEDLLTPGEKKRRDMIKAGMGNVDGGTGDDDGFEVVAQNFGPPGGIYGLPGGDTREYDSDNEDYDAEDYARTLALGQQMLRTSGKRALIDASYNRYSWNDPQGLPDWFVDDEKDHYRPQLPIARDVMEQMKDKFIELSSKPIKKVAEARARKRKRAVKKLTDAKKKASNIADNQDISGFEKMNAIKKAMRGSQITNPGKVYVVGTKKGATGTKGRTASGARIKLVDKRLKNDGRIQGKRDKGKVKRKASNVQAKRSSKKHRARH